ncbi:MAG: 2-amino-4-hydroxy-6-hydroxymethyldihydropteridine diphosphokinase [Endozoicomonas sp. (ex Botrylloides leachii)]|nr:2-amino-4-hydroxy-6-hydroxymethyldihydropteridine diphosphokinase [Endozoicomonas sp. (ex Botrylloides leachii)]
MYCIIGIGSNENPKHYCDLMIEALKNQFDDILVSDLYTTPALGMAAVEYINAVVLFHTNFTYSRLKAWCRSIEEKLGRVRGQTSCCADLDILYFSDIKPVPTNLKKQDPYYEKGLKQLLTA